MPKTKPEDAWNSGLSVSPHGPVPPAEARGQLITQSQAQGNRLKLDDAAVVHGPQLRQALASKAAAEQKAARNGGKKVHISAANEKCGGTVTQLFASASNDWQEQRLLLNKTLHPLIFTPSAFGLATHWRCLKNLCFVWIWPLDCNSLDCKGYALTILAFYDVSKAISIKVWLPFFPLPKAADTHSWCQKLLHLVIQVDPGCHGLCIVKKYYLFIYLQNALSFAACTLPK